MSDWLRWVEMGPLPGVEMGPLPARKTKWWLLLTTTGETLAEVRWHGAWRGYAIFPRSGTLFEPTCLREIAQFLQDRTREHRARAKGAR